MRFSSRPSLIICALVLGASASVPEGWIRYQNGDYPGALSEYRSAYDSDPRNPDAMYGMVNCLTLLHRYAEANAYCDRLDAAGAPHAIVDQKREWIRRIRSLNHAFGASLDGGPLFYSSAAISEPPLRYAYDRGRTGSAEAWFTLNQQHTFSVSVSHFQASFRPDTVWSGIVYLDTLYQSLNQSPRTGTYIKGAFTNQFGQPDTFYSDYTVPVRAPAATRQNQIRGGWSGLYPKGTLSAAIILGESDLQGQKRLIDVSLRQSRFLPWLDAGLTENVQRLDHTLLLQASPSAARAYKKLVLTLEPTLISRVQRDPLVPIPDWQLSGSARLGYVGPIWSGSADGAWGRRAFASSEEGRVISSLTLTHRQSYGAALGVRPWGSPYLKIYGLYKWEEYSGMNRHIAMSGVACQW